MKPSLKFRLFGEWKIFFWLAGGGLLLVLAFWGLVGWAAIHFLKKAW